VDQRRRGEQQGLTGTEPLATEQATAARAPAAGPVDPDPRLAAYQGELLIVAVGPLVDRPRIAPAWESPGGFA
jgi:hypothetical protein